MYVIIALILTFFSIIEISFKRRNQKRIFFIFVIFLTVLLSFRYRQGTDYYSYYLQFQNISLNSSFLKNSLNHGEIGWYMIMLFFKKLGMSFETFIALLSCVMMYLIGNSITKHSPYRITSLLIFYPTYFLTYCFSGIRQALVLSIFLGISLDYLINKNFNKYVIVTIVCALIHRSALILLIIPIFLNITENLIEKYCLFAILIGTFFWQIGFFGFIGERFGISIYTEKAVSYLAILLRIIFFLIIFRIHKENTNYVYLREENILYRIYLLGFAIYLTLFFSGTLSQRLTMPLKSVEVLLIPLLVSNLYNRIKITGSNMYFLRFKNIRILALIIIVILILNVETIKNINSYIVQGNYYSWVTPIKYPYISIFNKDKVYDYILYFE